MAGDIGGPYRLRIGTNGVRGVVVVIGGGIANALTPRIRTLGNGMKLLELLAERRNARTAMVNAQNAEDEMYASVYNALYVANIDVPDAIWTEYERVQHIARHAETVYNALDARWGEWSAGSL